MTANPLKFEVEIDKFGRILLPKKVREAMRLQVGSKLSAEQNGDTLTLKLEAAPYRVEQNPSGRPRIFLAGGSWPAHYDPVKEARDERHIQLLEDI